jgi:SAM-dependent methyltransferase
MSSHEHTDRNIGYQAAVSPLGGSYTDNKLRRLQLPSLAGKRFLDLGCNTGHYCRLALDAGASRVVGVDSDANVIAKARSESPRIEYRDTGWDDFPPGEFDVVIFLSAIHYAKDPCSVVDNVRLHIAAGGLLLIEGGLIFANQERNTDMLLPSWRKVGDRCRHLSQGYVRNHLLRSFEWSVIGPSEPRGGDLVPRHVIHARPAPEAPRRATFTLDVLEYFEAVRLSSETIVDAQPSCAYVRAAGGLARVDEAGINATLAQEADFNAFVNDIAFAVGGVQRVPLRLSPTVSAPLLGRIDAALAARGVALAD